MMRNFFGAFFLLFLLLSPVTAQAKKIVIGNAGMETVAPRSLPYAQAFEQFLNALISSAKAFDHANPSLFKEQIRGFNCSDEQCVLRYAARTGIDIVVRGRLEDDGSSLVFFVTAFGTRYPYNGKRINSYSAKIDRPDRVDPSIMPLIIEEHTARFMAALLKAYRHETRITKKGGVLHADLGIDGKFDVFRPDPSAPRGMVHCEKIGRVSVYGGKVGVGARAAEGDIILAGYPEQGEALEDFYRQKKREAVFPPPQATDLALHVLFTAPASAAMPLVSPLAYYAKGDWSGVILWAVNVSPYLYLEGKGFARGISSLKKAHANISRADFALNYFSFYMLLAGGTPLVADPLSYRNIESASRYSGPHPYLGNSFTAAYLSLIAGGGGHFYRGDRFWGYFYFHLNNVLVYYTLKEFASTQLYSPLTRTYIKTAGPRGRRWAFAAVLAGVKVTEAVHAVLAREQIDSGPVEEQIGFAPALFFNESGRPLLGAQLSMRF